MTKISVAGIYDLQAQLERFTNDMYRIGHPAICPTPWWQVYTCTWKPIQIALGFA